VKGHHDFIWARHPGVRTGVEKSRGERAADHMKAILATWTALFFVLVFIFSWMASDGMGVDRFPWILLNLFLSCFAALQCFVLLIANKRGEQIAAEMAEHTLALTQTIMQLLEENTLLTRVIHEHLGGPPLKKPDATTGLESTTP
jgi:uncharacterized membrane protein